MKVRRAELSDAGTGSRVLRRSIIELCGADHGQDETIMAAWLSNKTSEMWVTWMTKPDAALYVAETEGDVVGVGMVDHAGHILLNYVSPDARFQGASKALLRHMEKRTHDLGLRECTVASTRTAERFYRSRGYAAASRSDEACCVLKKQL